MCVCELSFINACLTVLHTPRKNEQANVEVTGRDRELAIWQTQTCYYRGLHNYPYYFGGRS